MLLRSPRAANPANQIVLPHLFTPRPYQTKHLFRPLFPHHYPDLALLSTPRATRVCLVWHRRAGKDKALINAIALAAWEEPGNYLYLLPEQTQAKKIIWRGIGKDKIRFLDHIPDQITKNKYASELLVELTNGSTIQFGGSDNYDSWMGTNPIGIVFSEYSLQDPSAWQYFRPILAENGGWAVFNYTPRGKNHGYDLHNIAKKSPHWYHSLLTIDDTKLADGRSVVSREAYDQEILDGMPHAVAKQEFYCDFEAALEGSYYGDIIAALQAATPSAIGHYPYDPALPVVTAWDIGLDATAVWFAQAQPGSRNPVIIDYLEDVNTKFTDTVASVLRRPYVYTAHFAPHDIVNRDHTTLATRKKTAADLGIEFQVTPRQSVDDGIEAARNLLPRCRFNSPQVDRGLDSLRSYEREYDAKMKRFKDNPKHNWASHGADGFRILAVNWEPDLFDSSWLTKKLEIDTSYVV